MIIPLIGIDLYPLSCIEYTGMSPFSLGLYFKPSPLAYFRTPVRHNIVRLELSVRLMKVTEKNVPFVVASTSPATIVDTGNMLCSF